MTNFFGEIFEKLKAIETWINFKFCIVDAKKFPLSEENPQKNGFCLKIAVA